MKDDLDHYLDGVERLPTAPTILVKLLQLFRQTDREVAEIVEVMSHDPSLTTEVLRRCNSAFFGNDEPVADVFEAVMKLGFYEVYQTTVVMFGAQTIGQANVGGAVDVEALWRHSAVAAIATGTIARSVGEAEGIAFTAGLLHDVGKIVMALAEGEEYATLMAKVGSFGPELPVAEKKQFGFSHGEVGGRLLVRWKVPLEVSIPVVCHHHATWQMPYIRVGAIVSLGNLMAHVLDEDGNSSPEVLETSPAMEKLKLTPEKIPALMQDARDDMTRLNGLLPSHAAH